MIRRILHACAAVAAALLFVVGPGVPAHADPQPQSQGQCTPAEWLDPRNYADCAKRLGSAVAQRAQCIKAPTPSSPDSGMAGWLTTRPDADLRSGVVGMYTRYGVGGYQLSLYDVSCASGVLHPEATASNTVASLEFGIAAAVIGGANGLRDHAYNPGTMWAWSDGYVEDLTRSTYEHLFTTFAGLAVAFAGLWLLWRAPQGTLSHAMRTVGWAIGVMVLVTAVAKWPLTVAHGFDQVGTGGLSAIHAVLGPGPDDVPRDRCVFADRDPAACQDHRTVAVRSSDAVTEAVLYRSWLRAELGSSDSAVAKKYGPALYDAQTLSWADAEQVRVNPDLRPVIVAEKGQRFSAIAEQIKAEDPEAYEHLQGLRGNDRVGAGLIALLSAVVFAVFDSVASFMILLGFLIIRVCLVFLPIVATWGVLEPASGAVRGLADRAFTALFNIVRYGVLGGLYLWAVVHAFDSPLAGGVQILTVALSGVACWLALRPLRALRPGFRRAGVDDAGGAEGRWSRLFTAAGRVARDVAERAADRQEPIRAESTAGRPRRPEARALPSGVRR